MSRSNYDKPFYVDVGTSVAAIRCSSNGDIIDSMDHHGSEHAIKIVERTCDRMNREFDLSAKRISESEYMRSDWSVAQALALANALANHGWERGANSDVASSCIYALCRMLKDGGNAAAMREALAEIRRELNGYCNGCTLLDRMTENPPDYTCLRDSLLEIERIVASALSAPPRNCELYNDVEDSWRDYKQFRSQKGEDIYFDMVHFWPFAKWLFAPASERKGEDDASK